MSTVNTKMRVFHRYLGFFLAGIMSIYATSGFMLILRDTDFLKQEKHMERILRPNLKSENLGRELRMRDLKVEKEAAGIILFKGGSYNESTGLAMYTSKDLPFFMEKLTRLHKAGTHDPLFFLNIFFAVSLLFFVVSAFWMFMPKTAIFKKGLYFTLAGIVLTLLMLFV